MVILITCVIVMYFAVLYVTLYKTKYQRGVYFGDWQFLDKIIDINPSITLIFWHRHMYPCIQYLICQVLLYYFDLANILYDMYVSFIYCEFDKSWYVL